MTAVRGALALLVWLALVAAASSWRGGAVCAGRRGAAAGGAALGMALAVHAPDAGPKTLWQKSKERQQLLTPGVKKPEGRKKGSAPSPSLSAPLSPSGTKLWKKRSTDRTPPQQRVSHKEPRTASQAFLPQPGERLFVQRRRNSFGAVAWWNRADAVRHPLALPAYRPWWACGQDLTVDASWTLSALRKEAVRRNVDTAGTKKDLLSRLRAAASRYSLGDDNFSSPRMIPGADEGTDGDLGRSWRAYLPECYEDGLLSAVPPPY